MDLLAWLIVGVLLLGVPAGFVYAVVHHRRRGERLRASARRLGFSYQPRTDVLAPDDPVALGHLERFTACRDDVATQPDFRYVASRIHGDLYGFVFDYFTRATPGAPSPLFHGTWVAFRREQANLPFFVITRGSERDRGASDLPPPYTGYGRRRERNESGTWTWIKQPLPVQRLSPVTTWLGREATRERYWELEGGGDWLALRARSSFGIERHRHVPADELGTYYRQTLDAARLLMQ